MALSSVIRRRRNDIRRRHALLRACELFGNHRDAHLPEEVLPQKVDWVVGVSTLAAICDADRTVRVSEFQLCPKHNWPTRRLEHYRRVSRCLCISLTPSDSCARRLQVYSEQGRLATKLHQFPYHNDPQVFCLIGYTGGMRIGVTCSMITLGWARLAY
jgi:hypothetical protein